MKHPDDPTRLADDPSAPATLAEALRAARGPAPDRERIAALGVALGLPLPPVVVPPPPALPLPAAPVAAVAGAGAKLAVTAVAIVGAVAATAVVGFGVGRAPSPVPARPIPAAAVQKIEARAPEPMEDIALPIEQPAAAPAAAPPSRRHHHARPAAPVAAEEPAAPPEAPSDAASRLREEAALVQRAERLLDLDPTGALRLTEERRRRFPTGALDQEAEVVAIDALLRLGRRPEATTRAQKFEATHAGSLHARRIKRLLSN